jgi:uncharacterized protein (TIGR03083 family)
MEVMAASGGAPGDVAALFATERAFLLDELGALVGYDWSKPTPCPQWTVLELCCHLVGDDFSLLSRHRDHHHGTLPPDGSDDVAFIDWLDNLQMEWVQAARRLSPRLVVDLLTWSGPQLIDLWRGQDATAVAAHVSWAGPDPVPVWLDQVRELSEYWIHRQQLRHALGRPPDLRPELVGPILDGLRWAYPYRLGPVVASSGDTVSIDISGPVSAVWHLVSGPTGWDFRSEPGPRVVATLSMDTDDAWRLLTNNLSVVRATALQTSGNAEMVDVLRRTRAIVGSPT